MMPRWVQSVQRFTASQFNLTVKSLCVVDFITLTVCPVLRMFLANSLTRSFLSVNVNATNSTHVFVISCFSCFANFPFLYHSLVID